MIVTRTCRFCKYFGFKFKKNGGIAWIGCKNRMINQPINPDDATSNYVCGMFEEDLEFKEKSDVTAWVCDAKCSGCEYADYDGNGMASPSSECFGCAEELNGFWDDYDKLSLQELIDKYTYGNDKVISLYMCGNFGDYFKGFKRVKKGDTFAFIKE